MNNKKGANLSENFSLSSPQKRFIAIICIIATSILFYGFTPSADEETPLTSVTIVDGEHHFEVETEGTTVGEALYAANITLDKNDSVSKGAEEKLEDNEIITVTREKVFYLNTSGKTFTIKTTAKTVGEALSNDGFKVGKYDEVIPDVNTPVTDGLTVSVARVYVDIVDVEEVIPFETITRENNEKYKGHKAVVQEGKQGTLVRTFKKVSKEGAGVTVMLIGEAVSASPVSKIVEVGTKTPVQSLTPGKTADGVPYHALPAMAQSNSQTVIEGNTAITAYGTFTFSKVLTCKATAYEGSSASNGKWAGKTATGRVPEFGIVAVDPSVIPLNSRLYIESQDNGGSWIYGFAIAGDTGGAIKGNKVDLCYNTLEQCYQFGRRNAIVYVLD